MVKVKVGWSRQASKLVEENNIQELKRITSSGEDHDIDYGEYEFDTVAEANAFIKGIDLTMGWERPSYVVECTDLIDAE